MQGFLCLYERLFNSRFLGLMAVSPIAHLEGFGLESFQVSNVCTLQQGHGLNQLEFKL
jgi:hypothetical protein